MILGIIPSDITTKEELLVWCVSEMRKVVAESTPSTAFPNKVTEAQGFYPSDVIAIQEISTVDGGSRHILRVLMPVSPDYYGASEPVYKFCGLLAP